MFSGHHTDKELAFRKAAAKNQTRDMIRLCKGININAVAIGESSSRKTAAHRAAEFGQVNALRLLYNLGADFQLTDRDGKKPCELVRSDDKETTLFFTLITDAEKALLARKQFFPLTVDEMKFNEEETRQHHQSHDALAISMLRGPLASALHAQYKIEAKTINGHREKDAEQFIQEYAVCSAFLVIQESAMIAFENALLTEKVYGACGEATKVSFASLVYRDEVHYPVDEMNIISRVAIAGHACLALNRDRRFAIDDLRGLEEALILDPLNSRIFFYQFVESYGENTVFKHLANFTVHDGIHNKTPQFPKILSLPESEVMYHASLKKIKDRCGKLLIDRSELLKETRNNIM